MSVGTTNASYALSRVNGGSVAGGLVGLLSGSINASYAVGEVNGGSGFGLAFSPSGTITNSYYNSDTFGSTDTESRTTADLQMPTGYTGIYANWNVDVDNDDSVDDPWDFGTSEEYPVLQVVDADGNGVKNWQEFGPQPRPGVFLSRKALSLVKGEMRTYTAVLQEAPTAAVTVMPMSSDSAVSVSVAGGALLIFTPENWRTAQTVTVHAVSDDNDVNETVTLSHTVDGAGNYASVTTASNVMVNVTDDGGIRVRIRVFLEGPLR